MSQAFSEIILSQIEVNKNPNLTQAEKASTQSKLVKNLRKEYEAVFDNFEANKLTSWQEVFIDTGRKLSSGLLKQLKEEKAIEHKVQFACRQNFYQFKKNVILVGRYVGCDIPLAEPNDKTVSRLHGVIFLLPEFQKILVVDVGSCDGIETKKRSSGAECVSSLPDKRDIIILDYIETVELLFGVERFIINPKDCLICYDNSRSTKFLSIKEDNIVKGCNHHAVCLDCSKKIKKCPVCRADIIHYVIYIGAETQIEV